MEPPSSENSAASVLHRADVHVQQDAAVRRELECLLASRALRDSDHLKRFLRYVVEHTLAGEADRLKEYRVGVDVFGRPASFDPKVDPVVRMAARRLRAKLREHYENGGQGALLRIEIPKGGYAACFVAAVTPEIAGGDDLAARSSAGSAAGRLSERRWLVGAGAVVAVLVSAVLVAGGLYYRSRQTKRLTEKDTIVLADFANSTGDPLFDDTLKTALVISLQQSPFLNVLSDSQVTKTLQQMTRPAGTKLTADIT
ncbi:MAG: hypothetical protein WB562_14440, partial [Candidatus Sulfotelmatobacter sp.]